MPANLTPQYQKAELEFRRAQTTDEQVRCLMQMLQLIPRHKGTEKLQADLKSRLRELRLQLQRESSSPRSQSPYRFPAQGAGRVVILGAPNSGKSQLLKSLTRAEPVISPWPFSTREPLPGMMACHDTLVQLIDTPPIVPGSIEPWLLNLIRSSDAALLLVNDAVDEGTEEAMAVIHELLLRQTRLGLQTDFDETDFGVRNLRTTVVRTHADDPDSELRRELCGQQELMALPQLSVNLMSLDQLEPLRLQIFEMLDVICVYTRRPGTIERDPNPIPLPRGGTVEQLALELHEDLFHSMKHARVWGPHVHDGQTVGRQFILNDGDLVEILT